MNIISKTRDKATDLYIELGELVEMLRNEALRHNRVLDQIDLPIPDQIYGVRIRFSNSVELKTYERMQHEPLSSEREQPIQEIFSGTTESLLSLGIRKPRRD